MTPREVGPNNWVSKVANNICPVTPCRETHSNLGAIWAITTIQVGQYQCAHSSQCKLVAISYWSTLPRGTSRKLQGSSQTWTWVTGFKVPCANHYTKPPWTTIVPVYLDNLTENSQWMFFKLPLKNFNWCIFERRLIYQFRIFQSLKNEDKLDTRSYVPVLVSSLKQSNEQDMATTAQRHWHKYLIQTRTQICHPLTGKPILPNPNFSNGAIPRIYPFISDHSGRLAKEILCLVCSFSCHFANAGYFSVSCAFADSFLVDILVISAETVTLSVYDKVTPLPIGVDDLLMVNKCFPFQTQSFLFKQEWTGIGRFPLWEGNTTTIMAFSSTNPNWV